MRARFGPLTQPDPLAIFALLLLWLLFFWRLFTPNPADQASLARGDFSGQFVAFGAYQYERMSQGQIPLWNPYNNGGLPFIADAQAAVFYPPRWLTIGISALAGGWSYNALQLEMAFHALAYSLLMYLFMRRLTRAGPGSVLAALVSAILIAYGGFLTSYPPLQLAILEAAVPFPLAALGILEATRREQVQWRPLLLAAAALGLSWLAGHPQTSWFMTYLLLAYLAWRSHQNAIGWRSFIRALIVFGLITFGCCAVTLLPGIEYLAQTARTELTFDMKGNGFPIKDILQLVYPGAFSLWSPLYIGLPGLFFCAVAVLRGGGEGRFWLAAALIGLIHSLGANSAFYALAYNLVPGLSFFRGQERAALIVANSLAILAGLGVAAAVSWRHELHRQRLTRFGRGFVLLLCLLALAAFALWMGDGPTWTDFLDIALRGALVAIASLVIISRFLNQPGRAIAQIALVALIVLDLFSVTMDHPGTYDSRPHSQQLAMQPPPLIQAALQDDNGGQPFRVDGFRGLGGNFGSLYGLRDMRGISPLFLAGPQRIINRDYVNNPLAWELFAVKYVFSASQTLSVASDVIATGGDGDGEVYLHRLADPRPFAQLIYQAAIVDSDDFARALMDDPRFDERGNIVLQSELGLEPPGSPAAGSARVLSFQPEEIVIAVDAPENALLSLAHPHYSGWRASVDGESVAIIRAYGGLSALEIPAGQRRVRLVYQPLSYQIGALISLAAWLWLGIMALLWIRRR